MRFMRYVAMGSGAAALWCLGVVAMGAAAGAAPAAHPDFSGVWGTYIEPGEKPFRAFRAGLKLPLTPAAQKKVDEYRALVKPTDDNPGKFCLGYGMPEAMLFSGGYPMQIVQSHDLIFVVYEAYHETRQFNFGDKIVAPGDRIPDRDGYSTAHWVGDTLVVETTSLKEQEDQVYPHSADARIVERYHLTKDAKGAKVLVNEWTLTDPAFYTKPVKAVKKWAFEPKGILLPYECNEEGWLDHLEALRKAKSAALPPVY
jgi:hypothetical protein